MIEPPDATLPLLEALQRFSEPRLLAELPHGRPASFWFPRADNAYFRATNIFFERLNRGELTCWARHKSPVAPWSRLPGSAWAWLHVRNWPLGYIARETYHGRVLEEWFDARAGVGASVNASQPSEGKRRGPRPKECKDVLIGKTLLWLANQGKAQIQARVREFIEHAAFDLNEELSDGTIKTYAREALELDSQRRQQRSSGWPMSTPGSTSMPCSACASTAS
jgi:hypothetical protein